MNMNKPQSGCAVIFANSRVPRRRARLARAIAETLEVRKLLSSSVTFSNGVLTLSGDPTRAANLTVNLKNNGNTIQGDAYFGHTLSVPTSSVTAIDITAGSASTYVFIDQRITAAASITAGNGQDSIRGGGGANTIIAGDGNDYINGRGSTNYIKAGNGNDILLGSSGNDTIIAGGGNDSVDGADGNDSLVVGNGNDTVYAEAGNDTIIAGNGKDILDGGPGNNSITAGSGLSTIIPGSGTNYISVANANDTFQQDGGADTILVNGQPLGINLSGGSPVGSNSTSPTWTSYSAPAGTGTEPTAVLQILSSPETVGIGIDVRALDSTLGDGSVIDANFEWNFGDPNGEYNALPGFNAAHIYTVAGTYNISLTVTNDLGQTSTASTPITISPDTRHAIYVDSMNGNDSNNGDSPSTAVASAVQALSMVTNNTEVFFDRGETFNLPQAFKLNHTNVLVGAYGSGAQPIINYTNPTKGSVVFTTNSTSADGVTVEDVTITTLDGTNPNVPNQPMGVMAGGIDTSVLRVTFDYLEYDVNASGKPVGLTVIDSSSPIYNAVQGYFIWDQGTDTTAIGNTVNGSIHEHDVRTTGATEILAYENDFGNYDGKGCIEIHTGAYAWIDSNDVYGGDIRVGPLGLWNEPVDTTTDCVIQNNIVNNSFIGVYPGAVHISIRNNLIYRNSDPMISVAGQDRYGRQSADIRIENNTGISTGKTGQFLWVNNYVDGITLENNLLVAPNLGIGTELTAPVYVNETDLSSFSYINGNVWPMPGTAYAYAHGGINYVDNVFTSIGYLTPTQWNTQSQVGTDYFYDVVVDPTTGAPAVGSPAATADQPIPGIASDMYGTPRAASGTWTAGAVQV
jgi:hypothetical protein